jgi:hypothetical protein
MEIPKNPLNKDKGDAGDKTCNLDFEFIPLIPFIPVNKGVLK